MNSAPRLLIIEDEAPMANALSVGLTESGFSVDVARDGLEGLRLATTASYDLVVLDVMLPGMDGWQVLDRLRRARPTPVLFLSARDDLADRLHGLESGGDDYLTKPFAFPELVARIRTILRRARPGEAQRYRIADLDVDAGTRHVTRAGRVIRLTAQEFALLRVLLQRAGQAVARDAIASAVWGIHFPAETNAVDVAIRRLRTKIDGPFERKLVRTVRGLGYMIDDVLEDPSGTSGAAPLEDR